MKLHSILIPARFFAGASMAILATSWAAEIAVDPADKAFLQDAYDDGMAEVKLGELALSKTTNAEVKDFAQHMIDEHGKANADLKTVADAKNVTLATEPTIKARAMVKLIDAVSDADFDKAYIDGMVADHKKAVETFEKAANEAKDAEIKAFAAKTLPTLKMHLAMAEALKAKVVK